jgi:hypothetical protein
MYRIDYEISLNENGRPCIELPDEYEQKPEDKFFAIEIARYYMQMVAENMDETIFDDHTFRVMDESIRLLGQLGDEMAEIQYEGMRAQGQIKMMMDSPYHVEVLGIEGRDALPEKDIVYHDRIFDRVEGLRVYVNFAIEDWDADLAGVYELKDGITNEHWVKLP